MSKKATKNTKDFRQYAIGDHVLGKVRGYPPWPGMVVDPSGVSQAVLSEQPPGKKSTFHCVLFFPMGDYAWLHPKDLSSLKRHEIEAFLADESKKRNGDLREGYRIALDPHEWLADNEKRRLANHQRELEEQEQIDQLNSESDGGDDHKKTKTPRKRKRDSDDEPTKEKKSSKLRKDSTETKKKSSVGKLKKNGKLKSMVESEDEGDHALDDGESGPSKKASPPPAKKTKRDKDDDGDDSKIPGDPQSVRVRDWRHKLQKTFLSAKTLPKPEAMPEIVQLFTTIESYNEMTIEQLQFSKIGKVMRHIAALPDEKIPRDEEFNFRARAKNLVEKWHQILNANKPVPESPIEATAYPNGKPIDKVSDAVTQGAKNLDLNGKDDNLPPADVSIVTELGDVSALVDMELSEA